MYLGGDYLAQAYTFSDIFFLFDMLDDLDGKNNEQYVTKKENRNEMSGM